MGGTGGQSGDSGLIWVNTTLGEIIKAGVLAVDLSPAAGGVGGEPGDAGNSGGGGGMGRGSSCGKGGKGGSRGAPGTPGPRGANGATGKAGLMQYLASEIPAPVATSAARSD